MAEIPDAGGDAQPENMDKQTLLAVLQFLKKNNLKDTEELLRKEAQLSDDVTVPEETSQSDVSHALAAYKSEGDPSLYEDHYISLKQFVESSLDVHKCELAMVLYPVFVHMYLELVYNNHEEAAVSFFENFSADQEWYYEEDLRQLKTVFKSEHMRDNQLLENFNPSQGLQWLAQGQPLQAFQGTPRKTGSKFTIRMSRDSYNHLKRHLQEKKQNSLLTIIQEHLFIDVFDGAPRTKQQIDTSAGAMSGEAKKDANKVKVLYGLLKEPDISNLLEEEEEPDESDKPKKKKAKKDPLLMKKAKNDPNAPSLTRIPLPELKDIDKLEKAKAFRESIKRVTLGPDALPSICFYTFLNAYQGVTTVDVCEDSSMMAAGFADSQIRVFSLSPNKLRAIKMREELNNIDKEADDVLERMMDDRTSSESKLLTGHSGPVYSTSFTTDRQYMVSASEDSSVRLWSLGTWTNLVVYKGHNYPVWDVKYSPHGNYFASCGFDRTVRLWSMEHYQPVRIFVGHLADVDVIQFHPNSNYIVSGSTDRTVRLWDIQSGNCVRTLTGHKGPVHSLAFSPDGRFLATGGMDKMVLLWDIPTGEMIGQLRGHTDTIHSLTFSRDGNVLASGGLDCVVKLWDVAKAFEEQDLEGLTTTNLSDSVNYEMGSYPTKKSPVLSLHFTRRNLLMAAGPYST